MQLDPQQMSSVVKRLNRAQGQIGGIVRMLEEGRECQDVVMQLAAVSKALDRAGFAIIATGLRECLAHEGKPGEAGESGEVDVAAMEKMFLSLA